MQKDLMGETQNFKTEAVLSSSLRLHQWEMHVFFFFADEQPGNALFDSRQIRRLAHIFCSSKSDQMITGFAGNTCRSLQTASLKNPSVLLCRM